MSRIRTPQTASPVPLEKGQIWIIKDEFLEVRHVGKYLVEFMITRKQVQAAVQRHLRVAKQIESIKTVLKFLHSHKAVLGRPH